MAYVYDIIMEFPGKVRFGNIGYLSSKAHWPLIGYNMHKVRRSESIMRVSIRNREWKA